MNVSQGSYPMQIAGDSHPSPEDLERYSMGRLAGPELAPFEEHLLLCEECQAAVAFEDAVTQGMRDAARLLQNQEAPARSWQIRPAWAFALGVAGLVVLIFAGV